ncbi:unnamed protein product [Schistosoma curassoni]|uniref:Uncharacterized protein n=1 Tax=Schistosoma curassoni TaxID=6186 RepID=A0A183K4T6_9TREM|nr:unnamed protein product [Schistosoma curassoni]
MCKSSRPPIIFDIDHLRWCSTTGSIDVSFLLVLA